MQKSKTEFIRCKENNMDRKELKEEALLRMKKLNLAKNVINDFRDKDVVYYSEYQNSLFPAVLYWVSNRDDLVMQIKNFEKRTGYLVYHAILTPTNFGILFSMLFVSEYKDEWEYERSDIDENIVYAMVENLSDSNLSDMGSIGYKSVMGGLERRF